jgi:xyloglucan-specific endo-beta-1,4-glucanase
MKFTHAVPLVFSAAALAAPTSTIEERATNICGKSPDVPSTSQLILVGQWDSVPTGSYTVYQDLWNMNAGTGSQCTTVNSILGSNLAWSTSWSWSGGQGQVKSYANAVVTQSAIKQVSAIKSIKTTWNWG